MSRRVMRAAFTPYVRDLGREIPTAASYAFTQASERFAAALERGDVYLAVDGEQIVGAARRSGATAGSTSTGSASIRRARAPGSAASCWRGSRRSRDRAASKD